MSGPAAQTGSAAYPSPGLPGLDPAWSRLVPVADPSTGRDVVHHVLDTGAALAATGVVPEGTILAVHGNPTWSYLWRSLLGESLRRAGEGGPAWRVVAVDQLEMGWSERTGVIRRVADRVRDLGLLTDALELDGPVVALGHDWGGVVVSGWALAHRDVLRALVLTNTAVDGHAALPGALRLALAASATGTERTTAFLDTTLAIAHPALAPEVRAAFRAPYRGAARRSGIRDFVADIPAAPVHPSAGTVDAIAAGLRDLDVPVLLLWGPRDPVFQERYLHDLIDRLPQAEVHRFEGAGHLLPEDVDVAGTVLDWLGTPAPGVEAAPDGFRPMWAALEERAEDDGTALVELHAAGERRVPWRLLARRVREVAGGLLRAGVEPGDRVSLLVPPGADLTAALYACLRIGAVVVVADAGLGLRGLTRAVRGARPRWIIGIPPALAAARALGWPGERIGATALPATTRAALGVRHTLPSLTRLGHDVALPEAPPPDALAAVLFTSGSTGPAKGVRYTQAGLAGVRDALVAQYGLGPQTGLVAGFAPFALLGPGLGCRTAVPDMDVTKPATLTAEKLASAVTAIDADTVFLSPAALMNVVATAAAFADQDGSADTPPVRHDTPPAGGSVLNGAGFAGVRLVLSVGAPVSPALLDAAQRVLPGASIRTPYGMTECLLVSDVTREAIEEAGPGDGVLVGPPTACAAVRIAPLDRDGAATGAPTTGPGVTGEILVRAPHMLAGYDRLARTDLAARAWIDGERWHRTGDVGHLDAAGRLWVEGRLPHVIVTDRGVVTPVGVELAAQRAGASRAAAVGAGPRGTQQLVVVAEGGVGPLAAPGLAAAVRSQVGRPVAAVLAVPHLPVDIRHNAKIERARVATWATAVLAGGSA